MSRTPASASRIGAIAALLAASVLLSRVLGYVREAVLAYQFGASTTTDAYFAAFQLPDLLNYLLAGGALSVAFIPFYARVLEERGEGAAERLFATVFGTTGVAVIVLTVVLWWWCDPLVALLFSGFDPDTHALTVHLTRIVLPAQIFFVVGGIVRGALMAHGRFVAHAAAPLLYNSAIIAGGLLLGPRIGVEGFAWGVLAGAILGPFGVPLLSVRRQLRIRIRVAPTDRDLLAYLVIAAPLMVGLSLLTVDEWYDKIFGADLGAGTISILQYARRLMQAPVSMVGQAIAAAALPTLARLFNQGRRRELDLTVLRTLQAGLALALLAGGAFVALADPVVQLVYRHGNLGAESAARVVLILRIFCLAVPAWVVQQIASRSFFARGDTWRPMLLGTIVALAALPLYQSLALRWGGVGLASAGVVAVSFNAAATLAWGRRLHGAPALGRLIGTGVRALAVALPATAAALALQRPGAGLAASLANLVRGGVAFGALAGLGLWWIGDAAVRETALRWLRGLGARRDR